MDRRGRYLDTALQLFCQHGFHGVTMDQLVAEAGGSKATLYRYFPSKEALFEAIIDDIAGAGGPPDLVEHLDKVSLEEGLRVIVEATVAGALDPRTIALLRLAAGEYERFPHLARSLFEHGPARNYRRLTRFLEARRAAGEVRIDDLQIAAEQLLAGTVGHQQLRMMLGISTPTDAELADRIRAAIRSFVAAYGSEPPRPDRP